MENLISLKCKNCGAQLSVKTTQSKCVCSFCDSEFIIDRDFSKDTDFTVVAGRLTAYNGSSPLLVIPEGVISIAEKCFENMITIESVGFPSSLVYIENEAFSGCTNLKQVNLPKSLKKIGDSAFRNSGLVDAVLPPDTETIGKYAFADCTGLKTVTLPQKNVNYEYTFKNCTSLTSTDSNLKELFCLSLKPSNEAVKKGDTRPTLYDAFIGTPLFSKMNQQFRDGICPFCGGNIQFDDNCENCAAHFADHVIRLNKKGCYIATCVYGSYDCPQVCTLRRYRDTTLAGTWYGRAFIRTYYAISPTLVKWFGNTVWFKKLWKAPLDKKVAKLMKKGVSSDAYKD